MNSIFGNEAPMIEYNYNQYELDYVVVDSYKEDLIYSAIKHESIKNRHRKWTEEATHYTFGITLNLFKYEDQAASFFVELKTLYRQLVLLWRRRDGECFKSIDDENVLFRFNKLVPFYISENKNLPDLLYLEFVSQDPIDMTKTLKVIEGG